MSYQPPSDDRDDAPARQPPGWYLDPISQQVLRWWDGTQWGQQIRPLPGRGQQPQIVYPQQHYDQHSRQPSFTPDPQYGTPVGQPPYQDHPQYPGTPYGQYPSPQTQSYSQQPGPPLGHHGRPPRKSWPGRHKVLTVLGGLVALIIIGSIAAAGGGGNQASPSAPATSSAPAPVATVAQPAGTLGATQTVSDGQGDSLLVTYTFGPVQLGTDSSINQGVLAGCPNVNDPSTAAVVLIQMQIRNTAKQAVIPSANFTSGEAVDLADNYSSGPDCNELDAGPMSIQWSQLNPGEAVTDTLWFVYPNVDYPLSDTTQLGQAASLVEQGWALNGNAAGQGKVAGSRVSNCGPNDTAEGGALLYDFIPAGIIPAPGSIFCG